MCGATSREPHLVVSKAVGHFARDEECRASNRRFLEIGKQAVYHALRKQPLLAEARSAELVASDAVGNNAVRLLDSKKQYRRECWIELVVLLFVEPHVMRVCTPCEMQARTPAPGLL
jgi:hypothetical protein